MAGKGKILLILCGLYRHAKAKMRLQELHESARQHGDQEHAEALSRSRLAEATGEDAQCLDQRRETQRELCESNGWRAAPALAALSEAVSRASNANGKNVGAFNAQFAPARAKQARSFQGKRSRIDRCYRNDQMELGARRSFDS